jgi:hypothetical protein
MKAQLAMLLAQMDLGNLHKAETQAIERGIWTLKNHNSSH